MRKKIKFEEFRCQFYQHFTSSFFVWKSLHLYSTYSSQFCPRQISQQSLFCTIQFHQQSTSTGTKNAGKMLMKLTNGIAFIFGLQLSRLDVLRLPLRQAGIWPSLLNGMHSTVKYLSNSFVRQKYVRKITFLCLILSFEDALIILGKHLCIHNLSNSVMTIAFLINNWTLISWSG